MVIILRFMDAFRKFEGIQVLTTGGPGIASTPLNLHIYNTGLFYHQIGYAAAYGVVMIVHDRRIGRARSTCGWGDLDEPSQAPSDRCSARPS